MIADQNAKRIPVALNTKRIRQRHRNFATRRFARLYRLGKSRNTVRPVKTIAFKVNPVSITHLFYINIIRPQKFRHAQIGVHRALMIWADHHCATAGFGGVIIWCKRSFKYRALRTQIMGENLSQLVVFYFANIGCCHAKGCQTGNCIGRRAAGYFHAWPDMFIQNTGALTVDQGHNAFFNAVSSQKFILDMGQDIHHGVANTNNFQGLIHRFFSSESQNSAIIQLVQTGLRALHT